MTKVFIDGSAGTTGLRIVDRLSARKDLELLILPDALRKDTSARADALARSWGVMQQRLNSSTASTSSFKNSGLVSTAA